MKKRTVRLISAVLTAAMCLTVCIFPLPIKAADFNLDATLINLSNADMTPLSTSPEHLLGDVSGDGSIKSGDIYLLMKYLSSGDAVTEDRASRTDINGDGKVNSTDISTLRNMIAGFTLEDDIAIYAKGSSVSWSSSNKAARITASAGSTVKVDFSEMNFTIGDHPYVVIDSTNTASIKVTPVFGTLGYASPKNTVSEMRDGIYALKGVKSTHLGGLILTLEKTSYIPEIYICANLESAEWILENRINPPATSTKKTLTASYTQSIAMRLTNMTSDDKTNTNGGMYHDFTNSKWPSITVDENDRLYVVASSSRMAHVDPFGATVMVTSDNGGASFSKTRLINNTIMDDRDTGITYLGNGRLLVTYFTSDATAYLPGGDNYNMLKPYAQGGQAPIWAATWNSKWEPTGGIIGNYLDIVDHINNYNSVYNYDLSASAYTVISEDYGKTWNVEPFAFKVDDYTSDMAAMVKNCKINKNTTTVPVTSAHGPEVLSDGTILYAGKVMDPIDAEMDSMGVYTSRDGITWEYLSQIPTVDNYMHNNFHELSVTETADGALLCAIRAHDYTLDGAVNDPLITIFTSMSYDKGKTWTTPEPTGFDGTPPHVETMENGDIVMTYSYRTDPRCIRAVVSTDGGRTWSNYTRISNNFPNGDDMGYPASAVLSDGTICTVYYGSNSGDGYSSIFLSRWTYSLR